MVTGWLLRVLVVVHIPSSVIVNETEFPLISLGHIAGGLAGADSDEALDADDDDEALDAEDDDDEALDAEDDEEALDAEDDESAAADEAEENKSELLKPCVSKEKVTHTLRSES
jgi:hypothetical protein